MSSDKRKQPIEDNLNSTTMRQKGWHLPRYLLAALFLSSVYACSTTKFLLHGGERVSDHVVGGASERPQVDRYYLFSKSQREPQGYGVYTYVLLVIPFEDASDKQKRLYEALLHAVHAEGSLDTAILQYPPSQTNLFCLPVSSLGDGLNTKNYDYGLARSLLDELKRDIPSTDRFRARLSNPGPFLISTVRQRLPETERGTPMLLADLSHTNPSAVDETIAEYEQMLDGRVVDKPEIFDPLKILALNLLYDAQDGIPNIETTAKASIP